MAPSTPFAHASEAEMARILDFYAVRWDYEPHTFPILWNLDGDVVESFSPDFYLPELDLYLEMTTLRQKLVRKKNRKLRRLRELYPAINIKLFYARDFRELMLKYGQYALFEGLSGSSGQVALPHGTRPERLAIAAAAEAAEAAEVAMTIAIDGADDGAQGLGTGAVPSAPEPRSSATRPARRRRRRATDPSASASSAIAAGGDDPTAAAAG
jgi:hypoxanthine phosphoribosyltransferase